MARKRSNGSQAKSVGDQLRAAAATVVKATAMEIAANLRASPSAGGTPVKTGHARANWILHVGSPFGGEVDGDAAAAAGYADVASYELADGAIHLTNNTPYILLLNAGWSKQAAALFIEAAIDRAVATMEARYGSTTISVDRFRAIGGAIGAENVASAYSPFGDG